MKQHLKNYIASTKDGIPVFYGYKNSDDFTSPALSLWVAIGTPKKDGSNYRRVPAALEADWYSTPSGGLVWAIDIIGGKYLEGMHWSSVMSRLQTLELATLIEKSTSKEISGWYGLPVPDRNPANFS